MADAVQSQVEGMITELQSYRKLGIFSPGEIKQIIKKRTDLEYKTLRGGTPQKSDWMAYVRYELNLNSLISLRLQKMGQ